jgi:hypothetical protein
MELTLANHRSSSTTILNETPSLDRKLNIFSLRTPKIITMICYFDRVELFGNWI